jgi:hypothetical protein
MASEEDDSGNYTCFVQNTVGSSSVSILLDIGSKNNKRKKILYFLFCFC